MNRRFDVLAPLGLSLVILGAWELACRALSVPIYLLPAPSDIGVALASNAPQLFSSAVVTLWAALTALMVSALFAFPLALAAAWRRTL